MKGHLSTALLLFALGISWAQTPRVPPPPLPPPPGNTVGTYPRSNLPSTPDIPDTDGTQTRLEGLQIVESPAKPVTVKELEETLTANRGESDSKRALALSGLVMTERVTNARLARWNAAYIGPKTRQALTALADGSDFKPLPAEDVPSAAAPSMAEQRQMMTKIGSYLGNVIPSLPNLIAVRNTTYLEDHPAKATLPSSDAAKNPAGYSWPLHVIGKSKMEVSNTNGKESTGKGALEAASYASRLTTAGEFGPILYGVMMDAAQNNLAWAGWERANGGLDAVFRFDASKEKSHYSLRPPNSTKGKSEVVGYRGEVAIRPSDGAIVRLAVEARPYSFDTLATANVEVEYEPVEIGNRKYMCPVHAVALSRVALSAKKGTEKTETDLLQTQLNDVVFDQYHVFRGESRVVGGFTAELSQPAPLGETAPSNSIAGSSTPSKTAAETPAWADAVAQVSAAAEEEAVNSPSAPSPSAPVEGPVPEPQPAAPPAPPHEAIAPPAAASMQIQQTASGEKLPPMDSPLRMKVDLVLVPVVVRDANGNVVGNLTEEDFRVFDDNKPQEITSFMLETPPGSAHGNAIPQVAPSGVVPKEIPSNAAIPRLIVYLFDDIHLKSTDLLPLRDAVLRNMDTLQPRDLVALISTSGQVALSLTTDRQQLRDALMKIHAAPLGGATQEECPDINYWMALQILRENEAGDAVDAATEETANCKIGHISLQLAHTLVIEAAQKAQRAGEQQSRAALTQLRAVVDWLAKMPSNKSVILISPGFLIEPDKQPDIADIIDRAIHADVVISALDARGLSGVNPAGQIHKAVTHDFRFAQLRSEMDTEESLAIPRVMAAVADGTGGEFITNTGDFSGALQKLLTPPGFTYVLGFKPPRRDGRLHELTVKLATKKGLTLQSRQAYVAAKQ